MKDKMLPNSVQLIEKVRTALDTLEHAGTMGWSETIDRLTYTAQVLRNAFGLTTISLRGALPQDLAQEALLSFLEGRRGWTPPERLDWNCPAAISRAFNSHMKHVIYSIFMNELRSSNRIKNEGELEAPTDGVAARFLDSVEDSTLLDRLDSRAIEDHFYALFKGDTTAILVLKAIFELKLIQSAQIAVHLAMSVNAVRNTKRRIKNRLQKLGYHDGGIRD